MKNISVQILVDSVVFFDEDTNIHNLEHSDCSLFGTEYNEYTDSEKLKTCLDSLRDSANEQLKRLENSIEGGK